MYRNAGVKLMYLPPYSLDLNPIEEMFAQHKLQKVIVDMLDLLWKRYSLR